VAPVGGAKRVEMRAYHGDLTNKTKTRDVDVGGVVQQRQLERSTMKVEGWGQDLNSIFTQAQAFVQNNGTEFLLLKFAKCKNWDVIAEAAVRVLGNELYNDGGDLNTKTLDDLQGKVVVLFPDDGLHAIATDVQNAQAARLLGGPAALAPNVDNILPWQNLQED